MIKAFLIIICQISLLTSKETQNEIFKEIEINSEKITTFSEISISSRMLQSSAGENFITCSKEGNCIRKDNVQLKLGWVPKIPKKNVDKVFSTKEKEIISVNPFANTAQLQYIKNSNYTCADGVSECFNSCCSMGFCSDPSNVCTKALKSSSARIYATCIAYIIVIIIYWSIFGYLGVRYSKSKSTVASNEIKDKLINTNQSIQSKAISALENFDDRFNSGYGHKGPDSNNKANNSKNIIDKSYNYNFNYDVDLRNNNITTNNKLNNIDYYKSKEIEMKRKDELDDHVFDQDVKKVINKQIPLAETDRNAILDQSDSGFEVKDLNF